jgi:predicted amidohydrolase YtcJ
VSPEKVRTFIETANQNDWRLVMSITTGGNTEANDYVLELLEETNKKRPIADRRFTIEHFYGRRSEDYYRRLKKLGIIIATNPLLSYHAAARSLFMHKQMEKVRISKAAPDEDPAKRAAKEWGLPLRDWLDAGICVSCGSDVPAASLDPEHPFLGMYYVITGNSPAGVMEPEKNASREEALRMYTVNNAFGTFEEDTKGTIMPGKLADMVVLSDDIMTVSDEKIKDILPLMTVFNGTVIYER